VLASVESEAKATSSIDRMRRKATYSAELSQINLCDSSGIGRLNPTIEVHKGTQKHTNQRILLYVTLLKCTFNQNQRSAVASERIQLNRGPSRLTSPFTIAWVPKLEHRSTRSISNDSYYFQSLSTRKSVRHRSSPAWTSQKRRKRWTDAMYRRSSSAHSVLIRLAIREKH
jgi:hypothetical protein